MSLSQLYSANPLLQPPKEVMLGGDTRRVEQLVFFATHELPTLDVKLFNHYSRQLNMGISPTGMVTRMWILMFNKAYGKVASLLRTKSPPLEMPTAVWGIEALRKAFPRMAQAMDSSPGLKKTDEEMHR